MIRKVSAEDIAIRGNGTGLEYMCPTRHFVYIFFNPVFQVSTAKNEINLFNYHILIEAPVTFAPAGAITPSAEFLLKFDRICLESLYLYVEPLRKHQHWYNFAFVSKPRERKKKRKYMRENTQNVFLKINYAEIILQKWFNEIFVWIEADQHELRSCLLHKNCGKTRRLVQQQTNKRQLSMKYQQQNICSRRKASKTIANRLTLRLFCATGTRLRI